MKFKIFLAILRKDVRSLYPIVALTALLVAADVFLTRLELLPVWASFRQPVLLLSCVVLIFSVLQLDSAVSLVDDWLCRPVPKKALLAAKLFLVLSTTYLPAVVATFICDLVLRFSLKESVLDSILLQDPYVFLILPIVFLTAAVTRTLVQGIGILVAILLCIFVIPTPLIHAPGPLDVQIGEALSNAGLEWIAMTPAKAASILLAGLGFWLVYARRGIWSGRIVLVLTAALTLLFVLLPMWLLPWSPVFALQTSTLAKTDAGATASPVRLQSSRVCFPASRIADFPSDTAFNAALQLNGLRLLPDEDLRAQGSDAVAFVTRVEPHRLPLDWRVKLNYVQANYYEGGNAPAYSLRPAVYITDNRGGNALSHAWVLPASAVKELRDKDPSLRLNYSLTLLKPRNYEIATDGKRHELSGFGFCSASMSVSGNSIEVDCFSASDAPAQLSAELNGISASRVFSDANFSPSWTRWAYSQRVKVTLGSPRLARHDSITVTTWRVAGYLNESLTLPGILGAAGCPLPSVGGANFQKSVWRDAAPHESYSVTVDEGVQLEVLDFGGDGVPILLLPGLGATAHSYDDIAPLLARKHRVIAMTRRGTGYSSKPDFGFDTPRLAADVLQVMDEMHLNKVVLVGSSIAGEELTWLGGQHPDRFAGLVYLDAAYDRSPTGSLQSDRLRELNRSLPPEPPIPPAELRDYNTLSQFMQRRGHVRYPEGELIAFLQVNNPYLAGVPTIDSRTQQAITAAIQPPNYAALKIPALAIFALGKSNQPLPPWYDVNDKELIANVAEISRIASTVKRRNIELFKHSVEHGEVLEMPNAAHYMVQSNPQEVVAAIESFSTRLDSNN